MLDLIKTKKHALILSHQGPDGDSVGSSVSLSLYLDKIGVRNKIIFPDHYPNFLSWMSGLENSLVAAENLQLVIDSTFYWCGCASELCVCAVREPRRPRGACAIA